MDSILFVLGGLIVGGLIGWKVGYAQAVKNMKEDLSALQAQFLSSETIATTLKKVGN